MQSDLSLHIYAPTEPLPEGYAEQIISGEKALLEKTISWLSLQVSSAVKDTRNNFSAVDRWEYYRRTTNMYLCVATLDYDNAAKGLMVGFSEFEIGELQLLSYPNFVSGRRDTCKVHVMHVTTTARRRKVASKMLASIEQFATHAKCRRIVATYNTMNYPAVMLYCKCNYRVLECQWSGIPKISVFRNSKVTITSPTSILSDSSYVRTLTKNLYDARHDVPELYEQKDQILESFKSRSSVLGGQLLNFNGGRHGFALVLPSLHGAVLTCYPLCFSRAVWTDPALVKSYFYTMRKLMRKIYHTETYVINGLDQHHDEALAVAGLNRCCETVFKYLY